MSPALGAVGPALLAAAVVLAALAGLVRLAARDRTGRDVGTLGALAQVALGGVALATITWLTLYLLALVGGFYESLTCKVVSIPACEDPLALPRWLGLPTQSVGGVMGVLPLAAVFLAKVLQPRAAPLALPAGTPLPEELLRRGLYALRQNLGLVLILAIELWLAALRGAAEASDRQVRLALGLDAELPAAYLAVAQWGAVVLALGLSALIVYLGVLGRHARLLLTDALGALRYGGEIVGLAARFAAAALAALGEALTVVWRAVAIAVGRLALKGQSGLARLWVLAVASLGRLVLKLQSGLARLWALVAIALGRVPLALAAAGRALGRALGRWRGGARRGAQVLAVGAALGAGAWSQAATLVVLVDATGSEAGRLEETARRVLAWADPDPGRSLLARGDRLIVLPVRAPGRLDPTYPALFNAVYPSNQLERYAFFTELRDALPDSVEQEPGTGLSDALRAAASYLEEARRLEPDEPRVLLVFGNGEDHAPPVGPGELAAALQGARVAHLNLGLDARPRYERLYREAGAERVALFDLAATRSLRPEELKRRLDLP